MSIFGLLCAAEVVENGHIGYRRFVSGTILMADDDLTWFLQKGYCLVSGERKICIHNLVKASVICLPLPHNLLPMSTLAMAIKA